MAARVEIVPKHWMQRTDVLVAIGVLCIVITLIIPLPPFIIDFFIAINLSLSVLILLTIIYIQRAIEFAIFPSLLLIATVFRLGIEVSTSRMILLGRGEEIGIVKTFGEFVVAGNFVVGIIIFLILLTIQFIVVVRGTVRVSEVAARFTLDAMPGKQMAIDADLNAGLITEQEARERRLEIKKEADFYGSMDGASRFVQGDVIALLIITAINIIGGLAIGVLMRHEPITDAIKTYTTLTIGSALAAQIPAFLLSIGTGLIVAKSVTEGGLGSEMTRQFISRPVIFYIGSGMLLFLGIFTPLPKIPMFALSLAMMGAGYLIAQRTAIEERISIEEERRMELEKAKRPETVISLLKVDPMELEIGYALIPLVDPEQGGDLLDRITMIRRQSALEMGLIVPPIRIRDNMQLKPTAYVIKIRGVEVARGEVKVDQFLAMKPGIVTEEIEGEPTVEPAFGLPALWIKENMRERAELAGYTVVDPPSVIATHLTEVIKQNAPEILGRQEVQTLINNVKQENPIVVDELIPNLLNLGEVQKVLHALLREGISIRDMVTILETLADHAPTTKNIDILTEKVRVALSRQICNQYQTSEGTLHVITIDPKLEELIANGIKMTDEGEQIVLEPALIQKILSSLSNEIAKTKRYQSIILCSPRIRRYLKRLSYRIAPNLVVLSYNEIHPTIQVQSVGMVSI